MEETFMTKNFWCWFLLLSSLYYLCGILGKDFSDSTIAIAKQIALKHDGSIDIYSELSKGTEFVFRFDPIDEEEFVWENSKILLILFQKQSII